MHSSRMRTTCSSSCGGSPLGTPLTRHRRRDKASLPGPGIPSGPGTPSGTRYPPGTRHTPPADRHTPVNILHCPKLRLRAVMTGKHYHRDVLSTMVNRTSLIRQWEPFNKQAKGRYNLFISLRDGISFKETKM